MATAMASIKSTSNARSVSFVGLTIAIMAVSAWVTVPLGPVPFTLQMFAIVFAVAVLKPREAIAAMAGYLILGAVGLPVFSGMRGGLGILAGPTGGFFVGLVFRCGCSRAAIARFALPLWPCKKERLLINRICRASATLVGAKSAVFYPKRRLRARCRCSVRGYFLCMRMGAAYGSCRA